MPAVFGYSATVNESEDFDDYKTENKIPLNVYHEFQRRNPSPFLDLSIDASNLDEIWRIALLKRPFYILDGSTVYNCTSIEFNKNVKFVVGQTSYEIATITLARGRKSKLVLGTGNMPGFPHAVFRASVKF